MARLVLALVAAAVVGLAVWAALPSAPPAVATPSATTAPIVNAPAPAAPAAPAPPARAAPSGDIAARVEDCVGAQREVAARRQARNAPLPPGEPSDAAVVARACAPLYREPACHDAMMRFDDPPPAVRSSTLLQRCARAYCPQLSEPRPAVCANPGGEPDDLLGAWTELRRTILTRDLGAEIAARVLAPAR